MLCFVRKARVQRQVSGMNRSRPNGKQTTPMESEEGRLLTRVPWHKMKRPGAQRQRREEALIMAAFGSVKKRKQGKKTAT